MTTEKSCCGTTAEPTRAKSVATFRPAVDVFEDGGAFRIVADLPGATPADVDLDFEQNTLTLTARVAPRHAGRGRAFASEYQVGEFRRAFRFDESVDSEASKAEFKDGVLTVTLPKTAAAQRRKVRVSGT